MDKATFTSPHADAIRLESQYGTRLAYQEAKHRLIDALAAGDDAAIDHWSAVGLLVVDAWRACPSDRRRPALRAVASRR